MSRWGTALLLLAAIAAGVFLWVVEPRMKNLRPAEANRSVLLSFDPMKVRGIRIRSGGELIELTRKPDGWRLGPEPKDRADGALIAKILDEAGRLQIFDTIPDSEIDSEKDLKKFGLADSKNRIDILGDGESTIFFGKDAVGEDRVYVRRENAQAVYVVSNTLEEVAFQSPSAFRDRRLTNYEPSQIDRLTIRRAGGEIEIARTPTGWAINKPLQARADSAKIESLLQVVLSARILAFSDAGSASEGSTSTPGQGIEVLWYPEDREAPDRLWLGTPILRDNRLVLPAFYSARNSGYELDAGLAQLASITPDQLRDRQLLQLNLDTVDEISVLDHGNSAAWQRSGDSWRTRSEPPKTVSNTDMAREVELLAKVPVIEYQPATPALLEESGFKASGGRRIVFESLVSENTPETTAGKQPVAILDLGSEIDGRMAIRINDTPEIAVVASGPLTRFLDWIGRDSKASSIPAPAPAE